MFNHAFRELRGFLRWTELATEGIFPDRSRMRLFPSCTSSDDVISIRLHHLMHVHMFIIWAFRCQNGNDRAQFSSKGFRLVALTNTPTIIIYYNITVQQSRWWLETRGVPMTDIMVLASQYYRFIVLIVTANKEKSHLYPDKWHLCYDRWYCFYIYAHL